MAGRRYVGQIDTMKTILPAKDLLARASHVFWLRNPGVDKVIAVSARECREMDWLRFSVGRSAATGQ